MLRVTIFKSPNKLQILEGQSGFRVFFLIIVQRVSLCIFHERLGSNLFRDFGERASKIRRENGSTETVLSGLAEIEVTWLEKICRGRECV